MSALDELHNVLDVLDARGLRRRLRTLEGTSGRVISLDGRQVINFSSNDYLGLASHPELASTAIAAIETAGMGSTASRLIAGNHNLHMQLEQALAAFHGRPAARLFNSGYHANLGVLPTLARDGDIIFSDALNHASIIDGCRLSRAQVVVFPHSDIDALDRMMANSSGHRRFVITDSLFSMDGDFARLGELAELCHAHDAVLVVDEAHAVGVIGPKGRGLGAHVGVVPDVHVGTLGKAFGSFGAYVTGERDLAEILLNKARSFVFTTALPPGVVAASHAALALIEGEEGDNRRARLAQLIALLRDALASRGILVPGSGNTAIFPIVVGDARRTMLCCERLLERGIFVQGIRPPTVAHGTARLRFTLMATHTENDIDAACAALDELLNDGLLPGITREQQT